jgi:hypothetical protein
LAKKKTGPRKQGGAQYETDEKQEGVKWKEKEKPGKCNDGLESPCVSIRLLKKKGKVPQWR